MWIIIDLGILFSGFQVSWHRRLCHSLVRLEVIGAFIEAGVEAGVALAKAIT